MTTLKPPPVRTPVRPVPQPARPFDRPTRPFTVESAHRLATLITALIVVSLGSCTVAPLVGALEGARMQAPAQNTTAMVA
jgi:hypothetical protein